MKEVIFVLLNEFADWEGAFIAACLNQGVMPGSPVPYKVKTLSITKAPVSSIGGFRVLPDYDLKDMPEDYAGLILIGGMSWFSPEAELIAPLIEKAIKDKKVVGGICNASVFSLCSTNQCRLIFFQNFFHSFLNISFFCKKTNLII